MIKCNEFVKFNEHFGLQLQKCVYEFIAENVHCCRPPDTNIPYGLAAAFFSPIASTNLLEMFVLFFFRACIECVFTDEWYPMQTIFKGKFQPMPE